MEMDCEMVDTGLVLGLGYGGTSCSSPSTQKPTKGSPSLIITHTSDSKEQLLPSLTLGLGHHHHHHHHREVSVLEDPKVRINPSSPQSMASSLSNSFQSSVNKVKRERDVAFSGGDHDEERALSSRISDEEEDANGKKKLRLTKDQSALLEDRFKEHSTLNPKQKVTLAKQLNLRPRQVEVWFQNRRARTKLKQTEVDCEVLRRCCENLRDENRRLKNELQQLKSVKISPTTPLYMQINVCPSCERINGTNTTAAGDDSGEAPTPNFVVAQKPLFFNSFPHSSSSAAC